MKREYVKIAKAILGVKGLDFKLEKALAKAEHLFNTNCGWELDQKLNDREVVEAIIILWRLDVLK